MERLLRWTLDMILRQPLLLWTCVIVTLLGAVIGGPWWYGPMLLDSPLWTWPFIPDCPLASLGVTVSLLALNAGKRWPLFYALVAFASMKYGAWTIGFWLRQWSVTGQILPIEAFLVITHIGLFSAGLLLVPRIGALSLSKRLLVIGWFVLSLVVDYGLGYHPPLASYVSPSYVFWLATALTALLGAGLLVLPRRMTRAAVRPATA